jgi:hypothetical protein
LLLRHVDVGHAGRGRLGRAPVPDGSAHGRGSRSHLVRGLATVLMQNIVVQSQL